MLEDASSNDEQLKGIKSSKVVEVLNKENNGTELTATNALKVYLYAKCGIWKTRFSSFFKGMFMHHNLKYQDITFEKSTVEVEDFQVDLVYAKGSVLKYLVR